MPEMMSESTRMLREKRHIACCSGASSITTSMNSPPIGAGPTTRIRSWLPERRVSRAAMMARQAATSRMSYSCVTGGRFSELASMRLMWPIFMAMALAPTSSRIFRASPSGTVPRGGMASSTSAAVCAEASRSLSQLTRKLAIKGTEISTSAIITNRIVRTRSLPDSPKREGRRSRAPVAVVCVIAGPSNKTARPAGYSLYHIESREFGRKRARRSAQASQQRDDAPHPRVRGAGSEIGGRGALANLGKRRIGQHDLGKGPQVEPALHGKRPGRDQLAGLCAHDGRAENAAARVGDDLDVAAPLALGLAAVVLVIGPAQYPDRAALARLGLGRAGLRELGIREGDPRHEFVPRPHRQAG